MIARYWRWPGTRIILGVCITLMVVAVLGLGSVASSVLAAKPDASATALPPLAGAPGLAAGESFSLARGTDGALWAWGDNSAGQLGDGTTAGSPTPVQILADVAAVAAGAHHSLVLTTAGQLWAWGDNSTGQLGDRISG